MSVCVYVKKRELEADRVIKTGTEAEIKSWRDACKGFVSLQQMCVYGFIVC